MRSEELRLLVKQAPACRLSTHSSQLIPRCSVQPGGGVVTAARDEGLIVITAGAGDVVRLVPPLTITNDDVDECVSILSGVLNSLKNQNQTV